MADRLTDALFKNGWKTIRRSDAFGMEEFKNENWPGVTVHTGGGWAVKGEGTAQLMAEYQARVRPLGNGGDYDKLADFLNWLGTKPHESAVVK